jgi:hypothetical protein
MEKVFFKGLFCPDNGPYILAIDRLFDIAPLVAVDDPNFPDIDCLL